VGRNEAAHEEISRAKQLAPDDPLILYRTGSLLFDLGDYDAAQKCVSETEKRVRLSDFVFGADLVHLAGRLAAKQGDDDRARLLLEAAVDVGPEEIGHARFAKVLAWYLVSRGEIDAARDVAGKALRDHPGDKDLYQLAGMTVAQFAR